MANFTRPLRSARRNLVSRPLLHWFKSVMPPVSETEREAIEAGSVWWDRELFSGRPDWRLLRDLPAARLSDDERAFMNGPVEELCAMLDDWQINFELKDLPPEIWDFLKQKKFFGMIIPEEYGGLGFSAFGHSSVVMKIATRSITTAVTVMVPNSLGPGELLIHYGTDEQKSYYLPRLASGEELPCFALTGPLNGSDAANMPDEGVVCWGEVDGKRTLGMRVSWDKRYITLGPVATLLGLAFRLKDPDGLLGVGGDLGITLALVPTTTPGVEIGRRHYPAHQAFQNGPNRGQDVFIPMDWVIGGQDRVGQGWRMLMSALAAGRAISLPSLSTGGTKVAARSTGAYARVRRQFGIPIGKFEGIEEPLTRIAASAYMLEAGRQVTTTAIDQGEKPAILSAIMKFHATDAMRRAVDDAMDVHGGKAICEGPRNYLANAYHAMPVSITVEGANILTRSLIIAGQGIFRCHPYVLTEMLAASDPDEAAGLEKFDEVLYRHIWFDISNVARTFFHNLTFGRLAGSPAAGDLRPYYRQISRWSVTFATMAEILMATLGGGLRRREKLSARIGDVLSDLYLVSCTLKRFEDDGRPEDDRPLVQYTAQAAFHRIQQRFDEIFANFPLRPVGWLLRFLTFPLGRRVKAPDDRLGQKIAEILLAPSDTRDRLTEDIFIGDESQPLGQLEAAMIAAIDAEPLERKMKNARLSDIDAAVAAFVLSADEADRLRRARALAFEVIAVDDFAPEEISPRSSYPRNYPGDTPSPTPAPTTSPAAPSTS
ncbi:MAG: acyl-CoA dehydrogenase [Alphaproteobacteria bacterium]